jgi:hypothetical protein
MLCAIMHHFKTINYVDTFYEHIRKGVCSQLNEIAPRPVGYTYTDWETLVSLFEPKIADTSLPFTKRLVMALFCWQAPRRTSDYCQCVFTDDSEHNAVLIDDRMFVFRQWKGCRRGRQRVQRIPIHNTKLLDLLRLYLKTAPTYLLQQKNGMSMTQTGVSKILERLGKELNVSCSVRDLRHMYVTYQQRTCKDPRQYKTIAESMGTSVTMLFTVYAENELGDTRTFAEKTK